MKYKPGDEVFVKAEITDISDCEERPYFVAPDCRSINWVSEDKIIPMDKTYADGLKDAWELAKKIYDSPYDGGLTNEAIEEIFGCEFGSVARKYTAEEALAEIEAYEKEKEIKVGDIVKNVHNGMEYIVLDTESGRSINTKFTAFDSLNIGSSVWKKTGKHIDIESLLKEIGE